MSTLVSGFAGDDTGRDALRRVPNFGRAGGAERTSLEFPGFRATMPAAMIRHTVTFRLKHAAGSHEEADFLRAARALKSIPGVERFECLRQTSKKNPFSFGLSMEFTNEAAYAAYSDHPDHAAFVQQRWLPEVAEFLELDYVPHEA